MLAIVVYSNYVVGTVRQETAMFYQYHAANKTAGYSGYVVYAGAVGELWPCNSGYWMIPGTWEYDWDNR